MILIQEKPSKKAIGKTSLFVSFKYDPKLVDLVKMAGDAIWDKKSLTWELPLNKLSFLIDEFTLLDDITFNPFQEDSNKIKISQNIEHAIPAFDYQSEGIDWIINRDSGLVLDPPGLGKTLQIIYAAEELKRQKGIEHCLIVCGINTLKQNWKKEIEKFSTESVRVVGEKINSKGTISYATINERADELYNPMDAFFVIVNKEVFQYDIVTNAILDSKNHFDMIVADEMHKMKDPNSQSGKNFLKLIKCGKYHFGLTGTPIINSPLDAYVPLKFIGQEKANYSNFKKFYCTLGDRFSDYTVTGYKNLDVLQSEIDDCSIRRDKSILNLPPKFIVPEYIEMDSSQQKFYDNLQAGIVEEADRVNIKKTSLLGMVTRLREAATCPSVLTTSNVKNAKMERCCELVDEIVSNGDKVAIFSTFKEPIYQLSSTLKRYTPLICTGDQSDAEVYKNQGMFQEDDEHMVILCTSQRMGTGMNLYRANYGIFLDSVWTDADETQTEDRLWRIGTDKSVIIYKLIAKGTIDERIQEILTTKRAISDYVVDGKFTNEVEELRRLLGL